MKDVTKNELSYNQIENSTFKLLLRFPIKNDRKSGKK